MPATPPLAFETSSAPQADATTTQYPGTGTTFSLRYDKLIIAVGAYSQSKLDFICNPKFKILSDFCPAFNVPGVKEHAHFLKDVKDARAIRTRILECLSLCFLHFLVFPKPLCPQALNKRPSQSSQTLTDGSFSTSALSVCFSFISRVIPKGL